MRGRKGIREKHLRKAGWEVVNEANYPGKGHELVLRHFHGRKNVLSPDQPRGKEVHIVAPTRPRAYLRAERELVDKTGRDIRPRIPDWDVRKEPG
jgi:hypothetical protein